MKEEDKQLKFLKTMMRCTKCILPGSFPGISFDGNGVCNYCITWEPIQVLGEEKLRKKLSFYENKGKKYDAIAAISGGRDSSFVLYNLVKNYNLRILALTIDSGFITKVGYRNIEKVVDKLKVDHIFIKNEKKNRIILENCKKKFHGWLKKPSIHTIVPTLNSGDKTMNFQIFKYANAQEIPLVIGGNNIGNSVFEQEHWKTGFLNIFPDIRGYYSNYDKFRLLILLGKEYLRNSANLKIPILKEYFEGIMVYFFESFLKPRNLDTLGFYDYIYWNEQKIISTIKRELEWKSAPDATTTWRIDDMAYPLINYIYYNLVGFTEHDEMYSKMIREGQITREKAIERVKKDHKPRWTALYELFDKLDVKREEVDSALRRYRNKLVKKVLRHIKQF